MWWEQERTWAAQTWGAGLSAGEVMPTADEQFDLFVADLYRPPNFTRLSRTQLELRQILGVA